VLTCKKTYRDIPFAHRQHLHDGNCALIHGHNWTITLTFTSRALNPSGFVVDFGKLKFIKTWIDTHLDHACLFNESDPEKAVLLQQMGHLFKPYVLPNCSSEGIAQHLYHLFNPMILKETQDRAWLTAVEIEEDHKNSARYEP
jgi:6-pyruvoyltetrahydropterin/6-carboxytetrahydropterin synthase